MNGRIVVRQQVFARDHGDAGRMRSCHGARYGFQFIRAHVFGGGVDQVTHPQAGRQYVQGFAVETGQRQLWRGPSGRHVAIKTVTAQAPAQLQRVACSGIERGDCVPNTGWQCARRMRVGIRIQRIFNPEDRTGQLPVGIRPSVCTAAAAIKTMTRKPRLHMCRLRCQPFGMVGFADQVEWQCGGGVMGIGRGQGHGRFPEDAPDSSQAASAVSVVTCTSGGARSFGQWWSPRSIQHVCRPALAAPCTSMCG